MNKEAIILFKELLEKGYTQTQAADACGIPRKLVTYYINTRNLKVTNKARRSFINDNYFDIIDTENKAYLLGFILADGSLSEKEKRICINNSIDDLEVIELIQKEISPLTKIYHKFSQQGVKIRKEQIQIRFNSHHMYNTLVNKYNIKPRKTYDSEFQFNFENIPSNLIHHFIRGYFDGDGSVSFYKYNNTIFFNFSFVFNSKNFTNQVAKIFENKFQIKSVIKKYIGKTANWLSLRFNYNRNRTNKIKEIYDYLYNNSNIFLTRKKIKFEQYFEYRAN